MTDETKCQHLSHLPSGKCVGCGEQHQPLANYQPGDDEAFIARHLTEEGSTDETNEGLMRRLNGKIAECDRYGSKIVMLDLADAKALSRTPSPDTVEREPNWTVFTREFVGGERYARDYEYCDAQIQPKLKAAYLASLQPNNIDPSNPQPDA